MAERYLYNGIELPKLPEWDKVKYPNVCITSLYGKYGGVYKTGYTFIAFDSTEITVNGAGNFQPYGYYGAMYWKYFPADDTDWVFGAEITSGKLNDGDGVFWSNFDLRHDTDGSIVCPTSPAPVPVSGIDYKAMAHGWFVGKRLAAMRGKVPQVNTGARLGLAALGRMILGKE